MRTARLLLRAALLLFLVSAFWSLRIPQGVSLGEPPAKGIELTFLANEGFLVRGQEHSFLIDAFVATPYSIYGGLPDAARRAMVRGEAPFDVDLALVSHFHRDHWQPEFARRCLLAAEDTRLVSSPQVLEELDAAGPVIPERARALLPKEGEVEVVELGGLRVETFRLSHGGGRFSEVQNIAHLVELGGVKLLHMGDPTIGVDLEPFGLHERGVDVALVPYWWLEDEAARSALRSQIAPRHTVAVHVPPREVEALAKRLAKSAPEVLLFEEPMSSRRFEPLPD